MPSDVRERLLGPGHPQSTNARKHLGMLFFGLGQTDEGNAQFVQAYRASLEAMGPAHRQTAELLALSRQLLERARQSEESQRLQEEHNEALRSAARAEGARPETLLHAANLELREGDAGVALDWSRQAQTSDAMRLYGVQIEAMALRKLDRSKEAIEVLERTLEDRGDLPNRALEELLESYRNSTDDSPPSSPSDR